MWTMGRQEVRASRNCKMESPPLDKAPWLGLYEEKRQIVRPTLARSVVQSACSKLSNM